MSRSFWKSGAFLYLLYILAFPAALAVVEVRPADGPASCAFRVMTGCDCPGCGLTRSFRAMGRLDIVGAVKYNPLGPAFFLGALAFWLYAMVMLVTRGTFTLPDWWLRRQETVLWVVLVLYLAVGFSRMALEVCIPSLRPPPPVTGVALTPLGPVIGSPSQR
jgi:hypothetical protein